MIRLVRMEQATEKGATDKVSVKEIQCNSTFSYGCKIKLTETN